jgi:hypothetical protein
VPEILGRAVAVGRGVACVVGLAVAVGRGVGWTAGLTVGLGVARGVAVRSGAGVPGTISATPALDSPERRIGW